ncbi:MAG: VOC family protein [Lysobacter sp.]
MSSEQGNTAIIPCLHYRNAHVAIDWLCEAFGFQRRVVHADERVVHHAQLVFDGGMVMLSSADSRSSDDRPIDSQRQWNHLIVQPDEIDGCETQICNVIVRDPDAHHARAKAAGAEIVIDIGDQPYGGRGYACRDIEGHLWWFGNYDPWRDPGNQTP